jgi:vitamin B12 transporter
MKIKMCSGVSTWDIFMKLIYACAAAAALILPAKILFASDEIETIVVTETRIPTTISESLSAVSVLDREDIERYQSSELFALMSRVPGVSFVRNGGRGTPTAISLRGNQGDHSLFMVDGVRVGSATLGSTTLGLLNTNSVERIEIVRGPKSNLYGADAIGGVVNIFTRQIAEPKSLQLKTSFGSNNTTENTLSTGFKNDRHSITAVVNTLNTDGIDNTESTVGVHGDKDAHRNSSIALNYQYQINDNASWKVVYNQNNTETEYDSDCSVGSWPNSTSVECNIYTDAEITSLASVWEITMSDNWQSTLQLGRSSDKAMELADNIDLSTTNNGGEFNTTKTEATWFNYVQLPELGALTMGLDYQHDKVNSAISYDQTTRDNKAAFVQYEVELGPVDTNWGLRYDDNEQFGDHTTVSFLAGTDLTDNLRLVGSFGQGFKAPTFNDLYYPGFGNANFVPEESKNFEIGLNASLDETFASVALFNNKVQNLIQYNSATWMTDQTAEAQISGIEFAVDTEIAGWAVGVSGTLMDPENKANGKLLRRRAERSISFDADYDFGDFGMGFSLRSESHRFDDAANLTRLGGYTTVGLRAHYHLNDEWSFRAKVDNLTDKQYTSALDFSLGRYLALGREFMLTIDYTPRF